MNASNTWKDNVGCIAVLLAILLSTVSGAYLVYVESTRHKYEAFIPGLGRMFIIVDQFVDHRTGIRRTGRRQP